MKRRLISLLLVVVMTFSCTACACIPDEVSNEFKKDMRGILDEAIEEFKRQLINDIENFLNEQKQKLLDGVQDRFEQGKDETLSFINGLLDTIKGWVPKGDGGDPSSSDGGKSDIGEITGHLLEGVVSLFSGIVKSVPGLAGQDGTTGGETYDYSSDVTDFLTHDALQALAEYLNQYGTAGLDYGFFNQLTESYDGQKDLYIRPEFQEYVLAAIKCYMVSPEEDYRVWRNLYHLDKEWKLIRDDLRGNLIFLFDGVSTNLTGTEPVKSGYLKDDKRYNTSAVCIVVQITEYGIPHVAFMSHASTMADNVRNESLNDGKAVPVVLDGIYSVTTTNHTGSYCALKNGGGTAVPCIRCSKSGKSYSDTTAGSNIHIRSKWKASLGTDITDQTKSSTGCVNIGTDSVDAVTYNAFMKTVTGIENARDKKYACKNSSGKSIEANTDMGLVIFDRYCYYDELRIIFGDDACEGGMTGTGIAEAITQHSRDFARAHGLANQ